MGVCFERRTMGARDGRGLLYSLGAENGSPHGMGNSLGWRNGCWPSMSGARVGASELTAKLTAWRETPGADLRSVAAGEPVG
jgi:hypothetical protein